VDGLAIVALVVSALALITSGLSAWYTRQQARATEGALELEQAVLELEKKRELERTRPTVEVRLITLDRDAGPWIKVEILNKGPRALDVVTLVILDDEWNLFQFEGDTHEIVRHSISPGNSSIAALKRPEAIRSSCPIRILATYRTAEYEWQELIERAVQPPLITSEEAADWNFGS
jgi:hypothetical protein